MVWGLRLNVFGLGAKWAAPRGKMGYALGQNGMHPGAKWDCPGAKWVGAWGKMGYALGQNVMCLGAKWIGAWG